MAAGRIHVKQRVSHVDIVEMSKFDDMGVHALGVFQLAGVGQGLEEKREGVVVGKDVGFLHADVNGERDMMRGLGVGEGSDEGVTSEDVGWSELGGEKDVGNVV